MQKHLSFALLVIAVLIAMPRIAISAEEDLTGFTLQQLDAAMTKGGLATQKIYSILTFDSDERKGANLAILSGSNTGWHVTILHRVKGGLSVDWRSGKLPDDIDVSSSSNFEIEYLDDGEQVVMFSGCAAHECDLLDGIFGMLLYSPRAKQVFFAHYRGDENKPGSFGTLDFSDNANASSNEKYKTALQTAMKNLVH